MIKLIEDQKKQTNECDWLKAGESFKVNHVSIDSSDKSKANITVTGYIENPKTVIKLNYIILGTGEVKVDYSVTIDENAPNILKIGMQFDIDNQYGNVTYFGKEPQPNYQDRNTGAL